MAKIKKKHLIRIGFESGEALKQALIAMDAPAFKKKGREAKLQLLQAILQNPDKYQNNPVLNPIAKALIEESGEESAQTFHSLKSEKAPLKIYGEPNIEPGALQQMYTASKIPVAVAGALMPDAHQGYGLPIGGVLATENAIIPYAVGVDIGCRMCLTLYDMKETHLKRHHRQLNEMLLEHTTFGAGKGPSNPMDDPVLDRDEFKDITVVKNLKDKAWRQIGSSGSGNHFVEFGMVHLTEPENQWDLPTGNYLAILSHSGSRGLGAGIAQHYTRLAMQSTRLPKEAAHLAWLDMDTEEGMEYWLAMNLAGDYASACHHHIHRRLAKALGEKPMVQIENHHNFAWKEIHNEKELIVHRKGATPAGKDVLGIIPGSMTAPGFIVKGKGQESSLHSASHGAGRVLSRRKAKNSITRHALKKVLRENGVTLIGGGLDEAPMAYKDIHQVMKYQRDLVDVLGTFQPKIVRMAGD